jgi:hypothetical protein
MNPDSYHWGRALFGCRRSERDHPAHEGSVKLVRSDWSDDFGIEGRYRIASREF